MVMFDRIQPNPAHRLTQPMENSGLLAERKGGEAKYGNRHPSADDEKYSHWVFDCLQQFTYHFASNCYIGNQELHDSFDQPPI